ncbi:SPW repeat protein [Streptantibioticus ferralitis]|uniref:SPW repeat protein n=1 Tax=Streptantibioticus ferralitis TaxID=236510 RepID=A0ABT5Z8Y1_9ACTN|nr:SPW repeat protein [Streptantibioticus ferralitis]MDF2260011.1 SPW repeat protein [Streptantibioticus ferralitis]
MADVSRHAGDLSQHPDVHEMRERYARVMAGRTEVAVDGLVLLAGLWCAVSAWTVHFSAARPDLAINNLIIGVTVAVIGLGLTMAPDRMAGLSWAAAAMGIWLIISPWVVTRAPDTGVIWSNVVVGAVICLLGLVAAGAVVRGRKATSAATTATR